MKAITAISFLGALFNSVMAINENNFSAMFGWVAAASFAFVSLLHEYEK